MFVTILSVILLLMFVGFLWGVISTLFKVIKNHYIFVICFVVCVVSLLIGGYDLLQVALLGCLIVAIVRWYFKLKQKLIERATKKERTKIQKILRKENLKEKTKKLKDDFGRNKAVDHSMTLESIANHQ